MTFDYNAMHDVIVSRRIRFIPISRSCFYGDVINKAKKFKPDTSRLVWF